jgi:hypothetical protein
LGFFANVPNGGTSNLYAFFVQPYLLIFTSDQWYFDYPRFRVYYFADHLDASKFVITYYVS